MIVADGVEWRMVYWVTGHVPKQYEMRNAVSDPPTSGWQHAIILRGDHNSTVFCPYTMQAWTVPNKSLEVAGSREAAEEFHHDAMRRHLEDKWRQFQTYGFQRDYDTCALVMRRMGWEVPEQIMTGGEADTRKKGGKETGSALLKSVKASGKRGKFLAWFLEADGVRSVREAMAEFSMTRSNALSYLYMLQKDHGIGYELVGDTATVRLPDGCTDPFNESQEKPVVVKEEDDDAWLC